MAYWRNHFDWRAQEARLNQFAQFRADIDGFGIHFIHERGQGPKPLPIILTHGWPGSFFEMVKIIPLLTDPAGHGGDPADAFDVIVPSLPGFGFSDRPNVRGVNMLYGDGHVEFTNTLNAQQMLAKQKQDEAKKKGAQ